MVGRLAGVTEATAGRNGAGTSAGLTKMAAQTRMTKPLSTTNRLLNLRKSRSLGEKRGEAGGIVKG